jgi:hypothetical protein
MLGIDHKLSNIFSGIYRILDNTLEFHYIEDRLNNKYLNIINRTKYKNMDRVTNHFNGYSMVSSYKKLELVSNILENLGVDMEEYNFYYVINEVECNINLEYAKQYYDEFVVPKKFKKYISNVSDDVLEKYCHTTLPGKLKNSILLGYDLELSSYILLGLCYNNKYSLLLIQNDYVIVYEYNGCPEDRLGQYIEMIDDRKIIKYLKLECSVNSPLQVVDGLLRYRIGPFLDYLNE